MSFINHLAEVAQSDAISVSTGVAIASVSALVGGAVAWGAMNSTVNSLKAAVAQLALIVNELRLDVAVLRDRSRPHVHVQSIKKSQPDPEDD